MDQQRALVAAAYVVRLNALQAVFDAPDDETMTAFSLTVAKLGNVKTQTLRAFSGKEMSEILAKVT